MSSSASSSTRRPRIAPSTPSTCVDSYTSGYDCGLEDVAFQNPDGSQVLVATTHDGSPHTLTVNEHGQSFCYTIPDGATVTFVWPAQTPSITGLRLPHRIHSGHAATVRFTLSEAAKVTLTLERVTPGRREHGRCLAPRGD